MIAGTVARAENRYTPTGSPVSYSSDGDWQILPNLYYSLPVSDRLAFGVGVTTPYSQSVTYDSSEFAGLVSGPLPVPYEASVLMVNFNPSMAIKLAHGLYLGVALM